MSYGQYVTFTVNAELYAVDVCHARTVIHEASVTRLPGMEEFVRGIIDFRGHGIPLIDLKVKLGVPSAESKSHNTDSSVLILELPRGEDGSLTVGVMVDTVHEVISIESESIKPSPRVGSQSSVDLLHGIARTDESFILVLDPARILDSSDAERIAEHGGIMDYAETVEPVNR